MVVEQFLAKKFNLLGDNDYEEQLIKAFHSSSAHLQSNFAQSVTWCPPDAKEENLAKFLTGTLKTFIDTHEKHLADNGDNGHYVGNRVRARATISPLFFFFFFSTLNRTHQDLPTHQVLFNVGK